MPETVLDRRRFLAAGGAGLLGALAGCAAPLGTTDQSTATPSTTTAPRSSAGETAPRPGESPYTRIYREAIPSVVMVAVDGSQGSGLVYDDGHLVTNAHVVGSAPTVDVRFTGGQWRTGDVVGVDPHSDLAAIAVDDRPPPATPLPFSRREPVIGQEVVAIGNPFDLDGSVTAGIVSGVDRSIPAPTGFNIPDAIQTDAAVNPGNSGGPLMSLQGRVVAVINSGGAENIAFGISAALTRRVVPALIESGAYDHSFMGITLTEVTPAIAAANDMASPRGLIVVEVLDAGPADGVLEGSEVTFEGDRRVPVGGDVMLAIDGTALVTGEDLGSYLALHTKPGDTVELRLLRDGEETTVDLELGRRPGSDG